MLLGGKPQLPAECWGTELQPFNEQFKINPAHESWDIVESVAQRLNVATWVKGGRVYFDRGDGNYGDFDNSTQGVRLAMEFLGRVQA